MKLRRGRKWENKKGWCREIDRATSHTHIATDEQKSTSVFCVVFCLFTVCFFGLFFFGLVLFCHTAVRFTELLVDVGNFLLFNIYHSKIAQLRFDVVPCAVRTPHGLCCMVFAYWPFVYVVNLLSIPQIPCDPKCRSHYPDLLHFLFRNFKEIRMIPFVILFWVL